MESFFKNFFNFLIKKKIKILKNPLLLARWMFLTHPKNQLSTQGKNQECPELLGPFPDRREATEAPQSNLQFPALLNLFEFFNFFLIFFLKKLNPSPWYAIIYYSETLHQSVWTLEYLKSVSNFVI